MSLRATNLNLLPVLRALLTEASITRAAASLGLSQPATSNALTRLRALFDDPLLVQIGRSMHLTPRAQRLLPALDGLCVGIEDLLDQPPFDLAKTRRNFVVGAPDYMALLLGPGLIDMFRAQAPGITVSFTDVPDDLRAALGSCKIDLAIVAMAEDALAGHATARGYMDRMVGVVARSHAFATHPPADAAALAACAHVSIDPDLQHPGRPAADILSMTTLSGPLRVGASRMLLLPLLAVQTNCVAVVPLSLAHYAAGILPIAIFELPGRAVPIDMSCLWSQIQDADPGHKWFRGAVDRALRGCYP